MAENNRLKTAQSLQLEGRDFLIKEVVVAKRANAELRASLKAKETEVAALRREVGDAPARNDDADACASPGQKDPDNRFKDLQRRLTKLLAGERRQRALVAASIEEHASSITQLERSLRECVECVLKEGPDTGQGAVAATETALDISRSIDDLSAEDRERVLESWLALEGVIETLYNDKKSGVLPRVAEASGRLPAASSASESPRLPPLK